MVTVPCVGLVWLVTARPVPMSLPRTVTPLRTVLAGVVPVSLEPVGKTLMLTAALVV